MLLHRRYIKGEGKDVKVKYFTGLPNFNVLIGLYHFLLPHISSGPRSVTSKFQELVIVLMRLRLNLPVQVLADMFFISSFAVSRIVLKMVDIMYTQMKPQIIWPDRQAS